MKAGLPTLVNVKTTTSLQLWRHKLGWTQDELERRSGINAGQISRVERRKARLPKHQLQKLADLFGIKLEGGRLVGPDGFTDENRRLP